MIIMMMMTRCLFVRLRRDSHIDYPIEYYYRATDWPITVDEKDGISAKELIKDLVGE